MEGRKLDVTILNPHPSVRVKRVAFDRHVDHCTDCQPSMCWEGQAMWRSLCLESLRLHGTTPAIVAGA